MRPTVFLSAIFSAAIYLGWFPAGSGDPQTPLTLATGAFLTISAIYGLAKG